MQMQVDTSFNRKKYHIFLKDFLMINYPKRNQMYKGIIVVCILVHSLWQLFTYLEGSNEAGVQIMDGPVFTLAKILLTIT